MSPSAAFSDESRRIEFFALAARIFGVNAGTISAATARDTLTAWDSVNHLRLVMETEAAFDVRYPFERIPVLATLGDFFTDPD